MSFCFKWKYIKETMLFFLLFSYNIDGANYSDPSREIPFVSREIPFVKLRDGSYLREVTVENITLKGIFLLHREGIKRILPDHLTKEQQKLFKFEIEKYHRLVSAQKIDQELKLYQQKSSKEAISLLRARIANDPAPPDVLRKYLYDLEAKSTADTAEAIRNAQQETPSSLVEAMLQKTIDENPFAANLEEIQLLLIQTHEKAIKQEESNLRKAMENVLQNENNPDAISYLQNAIASNPRAANIEHAKQLLKTSIGKMQRLKNEMETKKVAEVIKSLENYSDFQQIPVLQELIQQNPHASNLQSAKQLLADLERKLRAQQTRLSEATYQALVQSLRQQLNCNYNTFNVPGSVPSHNSLKSSF